MEQIKYIISSVFTNLAILKPETHNRIQQIWKSTIDKKAIGHTAVVGLQKGKLTVHVDSSAWLFQMNMQRKRILERLKEEFPDLTYIHFTIGKVK